MRAPPAPPGAKAVIHMDYRDATPSGAADVEGAVSPGDEIVYEVKAHLSDGWGILPGRAPMLMASSGLFGPGGKAVAHDWRAVAMPSPVESLGRALLALPRASVMGGAGASSARVLGRGVGVAGKGEMLPRRVWLELHCTGGTCPAVERVAAEVHGRRPWLRGARLRALVTFASAWALSLPLSLFLFNSLLPAVADG